MSVLLYGAETWTLLVAGVNTLEAASAKILDIRWWTLVDSMQRCFSDLVCQPLVTSYVIDISVWPCCTPRHAHDALPLMVDTYEGRKAEASWRRTPGRPRNVWLNKVQEDANALLLSTLWRSEIARGHGAAQQSTRTTRRR